MGLGYGFQDCLLDHVVGELIALGKLTNDSIEKRKVLRDTFGKVFLFNIVLVPA